MFIMANTHKNLIENPLYEQLTHAYQAGKWGICERLLAKLTKLYPDEEKLDNLRNEIEIRKSLEKSKRDDLELERKRKKTRTIWTAIIALVVFVSAFLGYRQLSSLINRQIEETAINLQVAGKFRDAQNLIQADRPGEANVLLDEISTLQPEYPGLLAAREQVAVLFELEELYEEATLLLEESQYSGALDVLDRIMAIDENYKDVKILVNDVELKKNLALELVEKANLDVTANDWFSAVANFEQAKDTFPEIADADFLTDLFAGYVSAIESIIENSQPLTDSELDLTEGYFYKAFQLQQTGMTFSEREELRAHLSSLLVAKYIQRADQLAIRESDARDVHEAALGLLGRALLIDPDNSEVRDSYDLTKGFLLAVEEFSQDNWEEARDSILPIYDADPGYAQGIAGQILYETYIYIGDRQLDNEQYDEALLSFENAKSIAIESQNFTLQIFEARRKIAFTLGLLGSYREANSDFQLLIQEAGIKLNTGLQGTELLDLVYDAEVAAYGSDHENAYLYYREALSDPLVFSLTEVYQVNADDYLLKIAREHDTLTLFIDLANPEGSAAEVTPGIKLSVPTWEN